MEKYITSDKVGELVAALHNAGIQYVAVEPDQISIRHADNSFSWVKVYKKTGFEDMVRSITEDEEAIKAAVEFDNAHTNEAA